MNFSAWSIKNPIPAIVLFVLLVIAGFMGFSAMKIQNFPDLDLPTISVSAALPGAAPGQLETEVARKIENAVATISGVKHIYTKLQDGLATITVEFRLEKTTNEALDDVRDAVNRIRADLPGDLRDPVISKLDLAATPFIAYSIGSASRDEESLSWFVENEVARRLLGINGVGRVARVGGVTREVIVALDPARMLSLGVTASDISRQLRAVQQEASGGRVDLAGSEQAVRTLATVKTAAELSAMEIPLAGGRSIRLEEVAEVKDTIAERRSIALLDGKPVVGFEISRSRGASEVELHEKVKAEIAKIRSENPDLVFGETFNMVDPVRENYEGSLALLYEGAILAIIVVWFFLRDWRATFVAATALPLSILPAFFGMVLFDFSINVVTLLSLSLVVGILVDDAIVEIENIVRHQKMGKPPLVAAREAADEIGLAVIATTFTLIAVFLPTAFMAGIPGKFFKQFGWTAALAVFASLLVARLLTPMMAAYIMKPPKVSTHEDEPPSRFMAGYLKLADWCLKHRWKTTLGAGLFFVFSIALVPLLPSGFIPPDDFSQTQISLELPPGSRFEDTRQLAELARAKVASHPQVRQVYTAVGGGAAGSDPFLPGGAAEARKATLTLTLAPREERSGIRKQAIEADLRRLLADIPGARVSVGLGSSGEKYILVLASEDGTALTAAVRAVERDLRTIPGLGNIKSSASLVRPEVVVRPDSARASAAGVTSAQIADALRVATSGDFDTALPKLNLSSRQVPIRVQLPDWARQDPAMLGQITVMGSAGPVPLRAIADISIEAGPAQINRYDRLRNVNIDIELNGLPLGDVIAQVEKLPSLLNLPAGVSRTTVGDAEVMGELFASFGLAMLTGVVCIYLVLVLLFKGVLQPITILAALPLSLGGAFVALLATNSAFSMPSLIGLIMLMGIATKNSILLVDYAVIAEQAGLSRHDALLDACRKRAQPIIMTTIAMGAGMMPIALGLGADPSFRQPMAVAVIGGLITSTFLSLLVIPVVYTYLDDLGRLLRRAR